MLLLCVVHPNKSDLFRAITASGLDMSRVGLTQRGGPPYALCREQCGTGPECGIPRAETGKSDGTHTGDDTVPDAKARIMRAFSWAAFGKGCITMRQDRAESDVVQDTLFGFFSEKGGLKCYGGRRENCTKAF